MYFDHAGSPFIDKERYINDTINTTSGTTLQNPHSNEQKWNEMIVKGTEFWEKDLLDFHNAELQNDPEPQKKLRSKIINGVKKNKQHQHTFYYLAKHIRKEVRGNIKWLHIINENNQIVNTCINKISIENKIIKHNIKHFTKAHSTKAYQDKICTQLNNDRIRDKIWNRELQQEDYNNRKVFNFLTLLKKQN